MIRSEWEALTALRAALRTARAASHSQGVSGNRTRIDRAEVALTRVAAALDYCGQIIHREATVIAGDIYIPMPGSSLEAHQALNLARQALADCEVSS